jgi:benzil reductase ((S)-benzoin forming)
MKILITGTSSGLGYELAKEYSKNNNTVLGISRSKTNLEIKQEICDFSNLQKIPIALQDLVGAEKIDTAILNAGALGALAKTKNTSIEAFNEIFKINVLANKIIIDWLLKNNTNIKTIIGISSGAALKTYYGWSLYCTSKAAFKQLISTYAQEEHSVHFASVAPGIIKTNMQEYINKIDARIIPSVEKFQNIYDTMDPPDKAAKKIISSLPKIKSLNSGDYIDLRDLQ